MVSFRDRFCGAWTAYRRRSAHRAVPGTRDVRTDLTADTVDRLGHAVAAGYVGNPFAQVLTRRGWEGQTGPAGTPPTWSPNRPERSCLPDCPRHHRAGTSRHPRPVETGGARCRSSRAGEPSRGSRVSPTDRSPAETCRERTAHSLAENGDRPREPRPTERLSPSCRCSVVSAYRYFRVVLGGAKPGRAVSVQWAGGGTEFGPSVPARWSACSAGMVSAGAASAR